MFALTRQDAQASNAVVTGILSIDSQDARVLFDSGATHSFISPFFRDNRPHRCSRTPSLPIFGKREKKSF